MGLRIKNILGTIFFSIGILLVLSLILTIIWVAYYSKFEIKTTPQMLSYVFAPENQNKNYKVEYHWIPLDSISRNIVIAFLAAEDRDFYIHDGFSPLNESDSVKTIIPNEKETITQKTTHSVFLTRGDSRLKKILETYFTVLEEYLWGKDRILEAYLNTVLLGDGIFGAEAASQIYFGKKAGDLTINEAALLASLPDNPQTIDIENLNDDILRRQKEIILGMALMMHIKIGKKPVDEKEIIPAKPIYKRQWRG